MTVGIRLGTLTDAAVLARLLADFNREFGASSPDSASLTRRFRQILDEPSVVAVLAHVEDPLGFALMTLRPTPYYDGPLGVLDELYVAPPSRGRGIGSALLSAAIAEGRSRGVGELHINVDEIDEGARRFYERHGFVNIEPGADYRMLCYLREL